MSCLVLVRYERASTPHRWRMPVCAYTSCMYPIWFQKGIVCKKFNVWKTDLFKPDGYLYFFRFAIREILTLKKILRIEAAKTIH